MIVCDCCWLYDDCDFRKMSQKILNDDEIAEPYTFSTKLLPTNHDCLRYVISRTNNVKKTTAIWEMVRLVETIWNEADCCPGSRNVIVNKFENNVWKVYCHLLREKCPPGDDNENKRSHKKNPSKQKKPTEQEQEQRRMQFEARRERRRDLASSSAQSSSYMEEEVEDAEALITDDGDCEESFCSFSSPDSAENIITRRMSRQRAVEKELVHKAVPTDPFVPSVPLRSERISGSGVLVMLSHVI